MKLLLILLTSIVMMLPTLSLVSCNTKNNVTDKIIETANAKYIKEAKDEIQNLDLNIIIDQLIINENITELVKAKIQNIITITKFKAINEVRFNFKSSVPIKVIDEKPITTEIIVQGYAADSRMTEVSVVHKITISTKKIRDLVNEAKVIFQEIAIFLKNHKTISVDSKKGFITILSKILSENTSLKDNDLLKISLDNEDDKWNEFITPSDLTDFETSLEIKIIDVLTNQIIYEDVIQNVKVKREFSALDRYLQQFENLVVFPNFYANQAEFETEILKKPNYRQPTDSTIDFEFYEPVWEQVKNVSRKATVDVQFSVGGELKGEKADSRILVNLKMHGHKEIHDFIGSFQDIVELKNYDSKEKLINGMKKEWTGDADINFDYVVNSDDWSRVINLPTNDDFDVRVTISASHNGHNITNKEIKVKVNSKRLQTIQAFTKKLSEKFPDQRNSILKDQKFANSDELIAYLKAQTKEIKFDDYKIVITPDESFWRVINTAGNGDIPIKFELVFNYDGAVVHQKEIIFNIFKAQ